MFNKKVLLKIATFSSTLVFFVKTFFLVKHCNRTSDKLPFLDLYTNAILHVNKDESKNSAGQIMNKQTSDDNLNAGKGVLLIRLASLLRIQK